MIRPSRSLARAFLFAFLSFLAIGCGGSDSTGPEGGNGNGDPTVATVGVMPSAFTLVVGETRQLTATPQTAAGQPVSASITWSSLDEAVATVSTSGLVSAMGEGSTTITASAGTVSGSAGVTVTEDGSPPDAPSDLVAIQAGPDLVNLSWTDNSDSETGFEVQRSLQGASDFSAVGTTGADMTVFPDESVGAETTYYYRVRAVGEGDPSEFSNVAEATTTAPKDPSSPFECEREGYPCTWSEVDPSVFERSDALGDEILLMFEEGQTVAEALAWIQTQPDVVHTIANEEVLRFRLLGGRPTWVFHPDDLLVPEGAPDPAAAPARDVRPQRAVVGDEPKSKRALVMSPYYWQVGPWDPGQDIVALLDGTRDYEGGVTYLANTAQEQQITVADFKSWGDYDVIHVYTHGNQVCEGGECTTVVRAGKTNEGLILSSTDGGVDLAKVDYGEQSINLSTDFFREQYPTGLPDTIVYISACRTTKGSDLQEALAGSGGVYLGWTESVWADTAQKAALAFFQALVNDGLPATSGFLSLREGDDLTIDRAGKTGAFATLDVYQGGDDLRIREVVFPLNPLTKQDLDEEQSFPYPVVGQPDDDFPDQIPYLIKVDGVDGDPNGFVVNVRVNGFSADPKPLSEGEPLDGNVWQVKGEVQVPFDAMQGQPIDIDVTVDLPEGGQSRWDEDATLGNPLLRFMSTIITEGGAEPLVRLESKVESEFPLRFAPTLDHLAGIDDLTYTDFDVQVTPGCTPIPTTDDGRLRIVEADFPFDEQPGVPAEVVLFIPPSISESLQVVCATGSVNFPFLIHYFAGFYSWHGGELCGGTNEVDEDRGGLVMTGWTAGSGDVLARKEYDRTCPQAEGTFTEKTTIELVDPREGMGGAVARRAGAGP